MLSLRTHSDQWKKCSSTNGKMECQNPWRWKKLETIYAVLLMIYEYLLYIERGSGTSSDKQVIQCYLLSRTVSYMFRIVSRV